MRIIYMGTGEIGLPSLRWLIEKSGHPVVGVFTQPDKRVGRKQILTPPEVKKVAEAGGIPAFQPERLRKNPRAHWELTALEPDLIVVMAYGQILPREVIAAPAVACVNLHASLLPRHRGASPIQAAIREGDTETGITLMHIAAALDAGDMILKETIPIEPGDTGGLLHDNLAQVGPRILERGLPLLESGEARREAQDDALATYAPKLERQDGEIDWTRPADEIARLIRAYDPWPGAHAWLRTDRGRQKLKIYPFAQVEESLPTGTAGVPGSRPKPPAQDLPASDDLPPGTIIAAADILTIATGSGSLRLEGDLQLEGRKRLPLPEFLRGVPLSAGQKLAEPAT